MARILFTACGVGYGHGSRSTIIIKEVQKQHKVKVVSYGKGLSFLRRNFPNTLKMKWLKLIFIKNKVNKPITLIYNLLYLPFVLIHNFFLFRNLIKSFKPDVIVSDFDANGLYAGKIFRIPVILISNMHMFYYEKIKLNFFEEIIYRLTEEPILYFFFNPTHTLIVSLSKPNRKEEKVDFFEPVVDEDILSLKTSYQDFVAVYMSRVNFKAFRPILKQLKETKFKVYGQDYESVEGNIEVSKFSRKGWLNDMANCSALICHGGLLTLSEATILKKPCYIFTSKNFFERYYNAKMIERLGFGIVEDKPSVEGLRKFLSNKKIYQKNLAERGPSNSNNEIISKVKELIGKMAKI